MDPAIEIRNLKPSVVKELTDKLDLSDYWKRLMDIIPEKLERFNYVCDVSLTNPRKYHSNDFW